MQTWDQREHILHRFTLPVIWPWSCLFTAIKLMSEVLIYWCYTGALLNYILFQDKTFISEWQWLSHRLPILFYLVTIKSDTVLFNWQKCWSTNLSFSSQTDKQDGKQRIKPSFKLRQTHLIELSFHLWYFFCSFAWCCFKPPGLIVRSIPVPLLKPCEGRQKLNTTSVTVPPSVVFRQFYYRSDTLVSAPPCCLYVNPVEPDTNVYTQPSLLHETRLCARSCPHS